MAEVTGYTLKYDIARELKQADGAIREEVLRPAGTTLPLRRAKGKHVKAANKIADDVEKGFYMMSVVTGLSMAEIEEMDTADLNELGALMSDFFEGGQPT